MAVLNWGMMVVDGRGKLGGTVLSRNKGGPVARNKVTPINPNTAAQSLQRGYISTLSKRWNAVLTDSDRIAWESFGQSNKTTSVFGNSLILSGIAAYQQLNRVILNAGGTIIDTPPIGLAATSLTSLSMVANHTGPVLTLAFTPTPLITPQGLYLFATPAISPGIKNVKNLLRYIGFVDAAASGVSIATKWEAKFGTFPAAAGQRIGVSVQVVDSTTGAITPPTITSTIVI